MAKVRLGPYDPKVTVLWSTPNPATQIARAAGNTMKGIFSDESESESESAAALSLPPFLYKANHGSPLEHAVISFEITQISRACLDQLVRHRIGSFTSSSQHYQDHSAYPCRVPIYMTGDLNDKKGISPFNWAGIDGSERLKLIAQETINEAINTYNYMISSGERKESARMFLPMAMEVRVIWTVNARALANFINLRTCFRNVIEMILLARRVSKTAELWFPELFSCVGPDCAQGHTICTQGKMACDKTKRLKELAKYDQDFDPNNYGD